VAGAIATFLDGVYGRAVREEAARVWGVAPFVASFEAAGKPPRRLLLRGASDLRVAWPGGQIDVIAVSWGPSGAGLGAHDLPLRAAALAAAREGPETTARAGVLFLGSGPDVAWLPGSGPHGVLTEEEHAAFEADVGALAGRLAEARHHGSFEGIARARCLRLGCGFVAACHGEGGTSRAGR
jgi:hypothetical protein